MMFRKKLILAMFGASLSLGLVACNHDDNGVSTAGLAGLNPDETKSDDVPLEDAGTDDGGGVADSESGTGTTTTGSRINNAHSIVLTYPITESIENLGGGVYKRIGKAIVTDREGNPVPDGTKVYFNIIDSIFAKGTISSNDGDSIADTVLTDNNPTMADGTLTTFDTAYVIRNEAYHFIQGADHVFLKGDHLYGSFDANRLPNAEPEDKNRIISTEDGAIAGNAITVTQAYSMDYPNSLYASGVTDYAIGASLLGGEVTGNQTVGDEENEIVENNLIYSITKDGVADFYVSYPANVREINSGCVPPEIDERSLPLGSAQVMLVASAGTEAITVDDRFCFEPVAPYSLSDEPDHSVAIGKSYGLPFHQTEPPLVTQVKLEDDNEVSIPYEPVSVVVANESAGLLVSVTVSSDRTDRFGNITAFISVDAVNAKSGDKATITFSSDDAETEVVVSVF